jgi:transposase
VVPATRPGTMVYTDKWGAYARLPESDRGHASVNHEAREWARDDDGDGVREVHDNTLEGTWTGFRTFLRPFRGVSKWYLDQYAAIFQWGFNLKAVTDEFLALLLGRPLPTIPGT